MSKTTMTAAFAALLAASPMALAQTSATSTHLTVNRIEPGQVRATDLKGSNVYDNQNSKVGSIRDIVFDRTGRVAAVVLNVDGKNVAVGMRDLHVAMNDNDKIGKITINRSRDELKAADAFQLNTTSNTNSGSTVPPATHPRQ